jgi:hypothetical protein
MFKTKSYFLWFLIFLFTVNTHARESVTPADIAEFGWEYVGAEVSMKAVLSSVYACKQPSNKGSVCARFLFKKKLFSSEAIFDTRFTSRMIKPFMNKCVEVIGFIKERDIATGGDQSKSPALIIVEITESDFCKTGDLTDHIPE